MLDDEELPDGHEPDCPGGDCGCGKHWTHDLPDGATVEDLAASLIREAQGLADLRATAAVFVRRGELPWRQVIGAPSTPPPARTHCRRGLVGWLHRATANWRVLRRIAPGARRPNGPRRVT